jgi:crotonobetainyl-CoA:carnitine CoA-transferase CaiB-like acyl-CoA transferase
MTDPKKLTLRPLKNLRILSLALNLPGPAALMRCQQMGARCVKLEPSAGDAMQIFSPEAYTALHQGIRITKADLKTADGQKFLHRELAKADVLLTSFRPSALVKLGLAWQALHQQYPQLSQVAIVGSPSASKHAETPGHDLTYLAENDLLNSLELPATLFADMGGSLLASEAVLQAALHRHAGGQTGHSGIYLEVALSGAASYLALPRTWGLTTLGSAIGGGHAGYQIYPCKNGRVAVAALEPHFAARLCLAAGLASTPELPTNMYLAATRQAIAAWLLGKSRTQLDKLALDKDIPMHTLERKP